MRSWRREYCPATARVNARGNAGKLSVAPGGWHRRVGPLAAYVQVQRTRACAVTRRGACEQGTPWSTRAGHAAHPPVMPVELLELREAHDTTG